MLVVDVEKKLKQQELSPIYVVLAEDPYWVDRFLTVLRASLRKKYGEVEDISWSGVDFKTDAFLNELHALSLFSSHRLMRVSEISKIKKDGWETLSKSWQADNSTATVVFLCPKKEIFKEADRVFSKMGVTVECLKAKPRDLPSLVREFAKEEGKTLRLPEAQLLSDWVGNDLMTLRGQTRLLTLFVGNREEISAQDIQTLFLNTAEKDVFAFTRALSSQNTEDGLTLFAGLMKQGEVPLRFLGLLIRHYRLTLKAKLLLKKTRNHSEISGLLKLPSFIASQYIEQAEEISWKNLIRIYRDLSLTDRKLKSSPVPPALVLEKFVGDCFREVG